MMLTPPKSSSEITPIGEFAQILHSETLEPTPSMTELAAFARWMRRVPNPTEMTAFRAAWDAEHAMWKAVTHGVGYKVKVGQQAEADLAESLYTYRMEISPPKPKAAVTYAATHEIAAWVQKQCDAHGLDFYCDVPATPGVVSVDLWHYHDAKVLRSASLRVVCGCSTSQVVIVGRAYEGGARMSPNIARNTAALWTLAADIANRYDRIPFGTRAEFSAAVNAPPRRPA